MQFTYRVVSEHGDFLAECVEADAAGEGKTLEEAVACLRSALEERMFRPDAVAPPSEEMRGTIELVRASAEEVDRRSLDLGGPGG